MKGQKQVTAQFAAGLNYLITFIKVWMLGNSKVLGDERTD
jgi:hypothetical protein